MGETTLRIQEMDDIEIFTQNQIAPTQDWTTHGHWEVIKVDGVSIIYTSREKKITFQGEAKARIPLVEAYLIQKRERECQQRNYTGAEIETEKQHIRENMKKVWYSECED